MDIKFALDAERLLPYEENLHRRRDAVQYFSRSNRIVISIAVGIFFLLQILILGFSIGNHAATSSVGDYKVWKDCGNSTLEARERGCIYDVMINGWVKEECYNKTLSEEHLSVAEWRYYSNPEATNEIPLDVIRRGDHPYMYTSDLHHISHCFYVWKLQALALEARAKGKVQQLSQESTSLAHVIHCAGILNKKPPYSINYGAPDFWSCGPYLS